MQTARMINFASKKYIIQEVQKEVRRLDVSLLLSVKETQIGLGMMMMNFSNSSALANSLLSLRTLKRALMTTLEKT